jgi:hypothetical protein
MTAHIFGLGPSARDFPGRESPSDRIYALGWDMENRDRADEVFEMHKTVGVGGDHAELYLEWLKTTDRRIWMQEPRPEYPTSEKYPLHSVQGLTGRDYFGSSVAYMIAYALLDMQHEIRLWGVDLTRSIYDHQRPNLEWLIGFAEGRGVEVEVSKGGRLMTLPWTSGKRYGWHTT